MTIPDYKSENIAIRGITRRHRIGFNPYLKILESMRVDGNFDVDDDDFKIANQGYWPCF